MIQGGEGSFLAGTEGVHGGSMAEKEQSSSELVEKALGSSVFDGKSSGSKRGPLRTHLGGYRSSGGIFFIFSLNLKYISNLTCL